MLWKYKKRTRAPPPHENARARVCALARANGQDPGWLTNMDLKPRNMKNEQTKLQCEN